MRLEQARSEARWKILHAEVLRGAALATTRRAEEIREETVATRAAIAQRRRWEAQLGARRSLSPAALSAAARR